MTETISSVTPQSDCIVRKKKDQTNQKRVSKKKQTAHCLSCHCHLGVRQYGQQKKPQHCNTLFCIIWISVLFDGRVLDTDSGAENFRWPWHKRRPDEVCLRGVQNVRRLIRHNTVATVETDNNAVNLCTYIYEEKKNRVESALDSMLSLSLFLFKIGPLTFCVSRVDAPSKWVHARMIIRRQCLPKCTLTATAMRWAQ